MFDDDADYFGWPELPRRAAPVSKLSRPPSPIDGLGFVVYLAGSAHAMMRRGLKCRCVCLMSNVIDVRCMGTRIYRIRMLIVLM